MNTDDHRNEVDGITECIIGCAYSVSNTLGAGFLEKVYENALALELCKAGLDVGQQELCLILNFGTSRVEIKRLVM